MRAVKFGTVARQQQATFRNTLSQPARSPKDDKGHRHGHLLATGYEDENLFPTLRGPAGAKDFFAARGIQWWNNSRSGDRKRAVGDAGPTRNLASSQISCVNFLLPLAQRPGALVAFLQAIDNDVVGLEPIRHEGNKSLVEFEWVGWDGPLEGGTPTRGAKQTSIDAFMIARTETGRRAYLIEWKYCEQYRSYQDKGEGSSGDTRRKRYKARYEAGCSAFEPGVPLDDWLYEPFYQIMRMLLLSDNMLKNGATGDVNVDEARVVVICPDANTDYLHVLPDTPLARRFPTHNDVEAITKAGLKNPERFSIVGQERLVAALRSHPDLADWAEYHRIRYGW